MVRGGSASSAAFAAFHSFRAFFCAALRAFCSAFAAAAAAAAAPAAAAAASFAGRLDFQEVGGLFRGGGGVSVGRVLGTILPFFERFPHGVRVAPDLRALPRLPDEGDIDGDGDTAELLPAYERFESLDTVPDRPQRLRLSISVPGGDNDMETESAADIHGKENVRPEHCLRSVGGVLAPDLRVVGGADGEVRRKLHLDDRTDHRPLRAPLRPLPHPHPTPPLPGGTPPAAPPRDCLGRRPSVTTRWLWCGRRCSTTRGS